MKFTNKSNLIKCLLIIIATLLVSIIVCLVLLKKNSSESESKRFPFISKRVFLENQNDILLNFSPLRNAIRGYVAGQPDKIKVYFEYLPSGISIGVNDREELAIASLIKTPIVMAIYKKMALGKIKKTDTLTIEEEHIDKGFGDLWKSGVGSEFTIEELIHILLKKSDNTASKMLRSLISSNDIEEVFMSLDIDIDDNKKILTISPKNYSSIMRSLYLSSYLDFQASNEILDILSETDYNDKIVAGIPKGIKVAHKIGIWDLDKDGGTVYNDCAIVYPPDRPYLLCIMVKTEESKAREYMKSLSKMVYSYVSKVRSL